MKKFNKNSVLALSLAAASTIAIGGTVAYNALTHDDESAVNTYTVDDAVDIAINEYQRTEDGSALEAFDQGKKLYPIVGSAQANADSSNMDKWGMPKAENYGDKIVTIKNTGDVPAKVRVFIAKPLALADLAKDGSANTTDDPLHTNLGNRVNLKGAYTDTEGDAWSTNWGWKYNVEIFNATIDGEEYEVATYYLNDLLAPDAESTAVMAGAYLDANVDYDDGIWKMGDYTINYDLTKGVKIPVYAEAVAENTDFETAKDVFLKWASEVKSPVGANSAEELNEALATGGSVYLESDADLGNTGETWLNSDAVINLNGSTIKSNRTGSTAETVSTLTVNSDVTLMGDGSVINDGYYAVSVKGDNANLTIENGTYKGVTTAINVVKGTLVIKGGTFEDISTEDNGHYLINCIDANYKNGTANVIIMGGTFKNWNPENNTSEGTGTNFLADGYKVVSETDANGDVWYTVVAE